MQKEMKSEITFFYFCHLNIILIDSVNEKFTYRIYKFSYFFHSYKYFNMIDKSEEASQQLYPLEKHQLNFTTKMDEVIFPTTDAQLMDTSFEQNLSEEHGKAIWNGSIQFLKSSLKIQFDESKGFNDENIIEAHMESKDYITEKTDPQQVINKNLILSSSQKKQMILILEKSKHIKKLVYKLYNDFIEQVFEQLLVLIYQIVSKYIIDKESTKLNEQLSKLLAPKYSEINLNNLKPKQSPKEYMEQTQNEIIAKAEQTGIEVSNGFFVSTKIRLINLKDIDGVINNSNTVRSQFQVFMEILAVAVYLCAEGCFQHPNQSVIFNQITEEISFIEKTSGEEEQNINHLNGRKRRNS